jgi:hypothetical protein
VVNRVDLPPADDFRFPGVIGHRGGMSQKYREVQQIETARWLQAGGRYRL